MTFDTNNNDQTLGSGNVQTIQVTANPRSTLRALSATFTASLTVLSELLQNARRAGATKVDVTLTPEVLIVADNGVGLDDMGILLSIAESGWDEDIQKTDSPYGIGWLSALFSCQSIGVMSKGKHVFALTSDLLDLKPTVVNDSVDLGFTEIRLHDYTIGTMHQVEWHLRNAVKGFPIPVFLNGVELERPDALEFLETVELSIGHVTKEALTFNDVRAFYLQGLPINVPHLYGFRNSGRDEQAVVHLDSVRFRGRMPDRDQLLNLDAAKEEIVSVIRSAAEGHIKELAASISEDEFVEKYAGLAIELGLHDLINGMSVFPAEWVHVYTDVPRLLGTDEECWYSGSYRDGNTKATVITRDQVQELGLFCVAADRAQGFDDLLPAQVMATTGALMTDGIPSWHWAHGLVQVLEAGDFTVEHRNVIGEEILDIDGEEVTLVLVEGLQAKYTPAEAPTGPAHLAIGATTTVSVAYDPEACRLYVTKDSSPRDAVSQVTNFEDDESYVESNYLRAVNNLRATLDSLLTDDVAAMLASFLEAGMATTPKALHGKTFAVSFDAEGKLSVHLSGN